MPPQVTAFLASAVAAGEGASTTATILFSAAAVSMGVMIIWAQFHTVPVVKNMKVADAVRAAAEPLASCAFTRAGPRVQARVSVAAARGKPAEGESARLTVF